MAKTLACGAMEVAEVAHDLKNVLMTVVFAADALRDDLPARSDAYELVTDVIDGAERAIALAKRLIENARHAFSEGGSTDLAAAVARHSGRLRVVAPCDVAVSVACDEAPLVAPLSVHAVDQILFNLVHNAIDAMPCGGELVIELRRASPDAAALVVRDTGAGMDAATRARCFEPFFTTRPGRGTGVGLHAVRAAIEAVGGTIDVDSSPGQGTTFRLSVPLVDE